MKLLLLSGFLGSGKTSALLQLAGKLVRASHTGGTSIMIIENEIGDVGVDDKVLRAGGLRVKELFAGCACCTGGASLLADIRTLRDTADPEWIVIEATGVADPRQIRENVEACFHIPVKILALADAKRWKRLRSYMAQLIEAQVEDADCILLNKVDLVEPEEAAAIAAELRQLNPRGEIHAVVANRPIEDSVWAFLDAE